MAAPPKHIKSSADSIASKWSSKVEQLMVQPPVDPNTPLTSLTRSRSMPRNPVLSNLLPTIKASEIEARSVKLRWLNEPKEYKSRYAQSYFQITRAEMKILKFTVVYEGEMPYCKVVNLIPETEYRFKLRFSPLNQHDYEWSEECIFIDLKTIPESPIDKIKSKLVLAIKNQDTALLKNLLKEHAESLSVEITDESGKTLLMLACKVGCIEIVKYLLEKGAKLDASTMAGKTPISIAVASGHVEIVKFLLSKNPKLHNYLDPVGRNLFIWAAETANIAEEAGSETKMIDVLVSAGVDIHAEDSAGYNAFDRLCMTNGNVKYAQALIEAGVKFTDEVDKKHPNTSLMIAALNGHAQLCKLLMTKYNCDPRKRSENGGTPLEFAKLAKHDSTIEVILDRLEELKENA